MWPCGWWMTTGTRARRAASRPTKPAFEVCVCTMTGRARPNTRAGPRERADGRRREPRARRSRAGQRGVRRLDDVEAGALHEPAQRARPEREHVENRVGVPAGPAHAGAEAAEDVGPRGVEAAV